MARPSLPSAPMRDCHQNCAASSPKPKSTRSRRNLRRPSGRWRRRPPAASRTSALRPTGRPASPPAARAIAHSRLWHIASVQCIAPIPSVLELERTCPETSRHSYRSGMTQERHMPNQDPGDSENRTTVPEDASHVVNEDGAAAYNRGDYATARRLWLPLAEGGNADAQTMLGIIYEGGHGVSQDYAAAVTWYRRAAAQGHPDAQFYLACMHDFGKGVPLDPAAAVKWLSKAADQGHTDAQFNLGVMYEDGIGVSQDHQAAVSWYREAAEQGYAKAQNNLGAMFVEGKRVPHDYHSAAAWFRKAAAQGDIEGQFNLGLMYENGTGVPQDQDTAMTWYRAAAKLGHTGAKARSDQAQQ